MKIDSVVTLEDDVKYYLVDETIQNDVKYFLATKLDEQGELTNESCIFEESTEGDNLYLTEVVDEEIGKYILSVFTTTLINEIDEQKKED